MKKLVALLLSVMMLLSLVACGDDSTSETPEGGGTEQETPETPTDGTPIKIGHLTYHTGPFGHVGPQFDAAANFALDIINEAPPLGGEVSIVHQDLGTIGEGQAARKLVDSENVDILLNVAGEYMSYRDWLLGVLKNDSSLLLPSVHAGAIDASIGGVVEEPIFRGSPMDTDQGLAAAIRASDAGAKSVVVIAVENDGMQLQQASAVAGCEALGLEVLEEIDIEPEQTSYRSVVTRVQALNPDALIVFAAAEDGGTVVKNAAEVGMSAVIIGPTDWLFVEFPNTATMSAINQHQVVEAVGFTYAEGPAWDFYKEAWESSEYADITEASNSYNLQYYDLLNVTMLAIKKAGSLETADWVEAMYDVAMGPGTKVYTYAEGVAALERGEDIDYDGVTGEFNYTDSGVVGGLCGVFTWTDTETLERTDLIDGQTILDVSAKIG